MATAKCLDEARDPGGKRIVRRDALWRLLKAIESASGCPSISDLARALRVSRQAAHRLVCKAERRGLISLLTNYRDRRVLQAELTPSGRALLESDLTHEGLWVITLLNGLGMREMLATAHILRVIRHRLMRDAKQQAK